MATSSSPYPLVLIGSTAVGKSDSAVSIARHYKGEIVSADARQVYRCLDKTTGKITKEEMCGVPHHMLDVVNPGEPYSVAQFSEQALSHIHAIKEKRGFCCITGGSGFYIDSLLYTNTFAPVPKNPLYRSFLETKPLRLLQELLRKKDPDAYARIDLSNRHRLIRALEIIYTLGSFPLLQKKQRYPFHIIGLRRDRIELRDRIYRRLEKRFTVMTEEVQTLLHSGISQEWLYSLGLECRFMTLHVTGTLSREETVSQLFHAICTYAKRQDTWWKRYGSIPWFHPDDTKALFAHLATLYT